MGKVWRARHTALKRDDALKVLPDAFASDPDRLARFEREAQVLASLNHPNIARVYGLEQADGVQALVMELVEGETLADRIARGPIPLDEALPIAKQIAEALEAAHEQGIIHRDLKPGNVKVRPDGTVKVLDFGLAKLAESSGSSTSDASLSPTITSPAMMTGVGVLLGTAAYMSPEQAKGRPANKRSDIWSLGCVLYELLTGRRAFGGEEISETLAEVIRGEPDWKALPAATPAAVRRLLRRCFIKDPKKRLSDAGVVRLEIEEALATEPPEHAPTASTWWRRVVPYGAVAVTAALITALVGWLTVGRGPAPAAAPMRFTIDLPPNVRLLPVVGQAIAISSDGRRIAYIGTDEAGVSRLGTSRLYVRSIDQLDSVAVRGPERLGSIFMSPDGEWIGFSDPGKAGLLRKVPVGGGPVATICDIQAAGTGFRGATWGNSGRIVFATTAARGLMLVSDAGGTPRQLTSPPEGEGHRDPHFLPDGRSVLFVVERVGEPDRIAVVSLDAPEPRVLLAGNNPKFLSSGHLVFRREGALWATAIDVGRLSVVGSPVPLLEGINVAETVDYDVAWNGVLVYRPGTGQATRVLAWVDRQGVEEPIAAPPRAYWSARLSPDGARIALDIRDQDNDIWIWDVRGQTLTRTTFDRAHDEVPVWTPDGRRLAFRSNRDGGQFNLFWRAADGIGSEERLTKSSNNPVPTAFAPDGTRLVFQETFEARGTDIMALDLTGSRNVVPLVKTEFQEFYADVSPDGRWIAYQSQESGMNHVFVRTFPNVQAGRWQVSTSGGRHPMWSRSGRELFFVDPDDRLTSVEVDAAAGFRATTPRMIVKRSYFEPTGVRSYDVSPDGRRFLMIKTATGPEGARTQLVVVLNWSEELKRLVPTN